MNVLAFDFNPLGHAQDIALIGGEEPMLFGEGWTMLGSPILTMHMVTMIVIAALVIWTLKVAADAIRTGPESEGHDRYLTSSRPGQLIEVIVLYLRDKMFQPVLGENTNRYLPYLLTLFFFILYGNILGLIPILDLQHWVGMAWGNKYFAVVGGTITGNLAVTAGLALIAFIVIQAHGLKALGVKGWAEHFLGGAPVWLAPVMLPVELMSTIIKPAALAIRLFANMFAGATLIGTLIYFGLMATEGINLIAGIGVSIPSIAFGIFVTALKLFISFLQAFIFSFLTAVFISQLSHHHDEHHEEVYGGEEEGQSIGAEPVRT